MVAELSVLNNKEGAYGQSGFTNSGCNPDKRCGNGLEKIYPTCAVRYGYMRYIGEFRYAPGTLFNCGGKVVIQTNRGIEIGEQVSLTCTGCDKSISRQQMLDYAKRSGPEFMQLRAGKILRPANDQDLGEQQHLNQDAARKLIWAKELAKEMNLPMKFVTCEHLLGGERIIFHFMSESRVDFRELVKTIAREYHTRIEMHQVGARDEARLVADYEICGRECCCKNFLKKLRQVNMKMAKLQKATLDPSKVSGRCGRLRCCLRYEHEGYEELNRKLPRVGARVRTDRGIGTVKDRQILTQLLIIEYDDESLSTESVGIEAVLERNPTDQPTPSVANKSQDSNAEQGVEAGAEPRQRRGRRRSSRSRKRGEQKEDSSDKERSPQSAQGEANGSSQTTNEQPPPAESSSTEKRGPSRRRGRRQRGRRNRNRGSGATDQSTPEDRGSESNPESSTPE